MISEKLNLLMTIKKSLKNLNAMKLLKIPNNKYFKNIK